jgi:peptidylprolyl isomerase
VRRAVALIASLTVLQLGLSACGEEADTGNTGSVTVTGGFGSAPKVEYDGPIVREETEVEVLEEGDGPEVREGGTAFLKYYLGNGYTGEEVASTWEEPEAEGAKGRKAQAGKKGEPAHGQFFRDDDSTWPAVREAMVGATEGSRLLVYATPEDSFGGQGLSQFGIGNRDSVVFVVDIVDATLPAPEGEEKPVPEGLPTVVESDGKVTSLDFSGAAKQPPSDFRVVTLVEGTGPEVEEGAPVAMRYLGQTWQGKEPFDENYSGTWPAFTNEQTGEVKPAVFGEGGFIKGWDQGIPGVPVGSRVMLVVPPEMGYGEKGSGKQIPPDSTLVFVVDILGQG